MNGDDLMRVSRLTGVPPKVCRRIAEELGGGLDVNYADLKNDTLRDLLAAAGADVPTKATKTELVALLENA